jgi:hypothetical protein
MEPTALSSAHGAWGAPEPQSALGIRGARGLYCLVRSRAIAPAAFVGGLLWRVSPAIPFYVAAAVGLIGTVVFAVTADERDAGYAGVLA